VETTYRFDGGNSYDLVLGYQKTSITDEGPDSTGTRTTFTEDDGFNTLSIRGRMFWNYTETVQFVPYVEFARESRGVLRDVNDDGENDEVKEKSILFDLALGADYSPHEKVLIILVGGVHIVDSKTTVQGEDAGETGLERLPYVKGGIEAEIRDWFSWVRLG